MRSYLPEVFLISSLFCVFLATRYVKKRWRIEKRLDSLSEKGRGLTREKRLALPLHRRTIYPVFNHFVRLIDSMTPGHIKKYVDDIIRDAGIDERLSSKTLLSLMGISGIGLPLVLYSVMNFFSVSRSFLFEGVIASFAFGVLAPILIVIHIKSKRQEEIYCSLPDMLDLLVVTVEAGYGFDAALSYVVQKMGGPLSQEFEKALQKIQMGQLRRVVFREMSHNTNISELAAFLSSISQAERLGVSIVNVLRVQSDSLRVARRQKAEELAMKAPIKMIFPLVFFIFPTLFIVILGPALLKMYKIFIK